MFFLFLCSSFFQVCYKFYIHPLLGLSMTDKSTVFTIMICAFTMIFLNGCSKFSLSTRIETAQEISQTRAWQAQTIHTDSDFDLIAFAPGVVRHAETLVIYIEGDGFAWRSRRTPSPNPTPLNPVGLRLAIDHKAQEGEQVVYLARPCQYIDFKSQNLCRIQYWTSHRFSPEVIEATNAAITILKDRYQAEHIILAGYSGGGAVAPLVAARRDDVSAFYSYAGNLDIDAWTEHHSITPLHGSLNPADYWRELSGIPQVHYVGAEDKIVPANIAHSYAARFPEDQRPKIIVQQGKDHHCCWVD